jgi:hypothetical protein
MRWQQNLEIQSTTGVFSSQDLPQRSAKVRDSWGCTGSHREATTAMLTVEMRVAGDEARAITRRIPMGKKGRKGMKVRGKYPFIDGREEGSCAGDAHLCGSTRQQRSGGRWHRGKSQVGDGGG